ncbi:MAG: trehalose-6-phosphate synthase [Acidimicrobiales bacterium]
MSQLADLVIVANRLPVSRVDGEERRSSWEISPGGLVSALTPAMAEYDGVAWLGWAGSEVESDLQPFDHGGLRLVPITLSEEERENHYEGMSNGTLWPLYHDKVEPAVFHRHWFNSYRKVNRRFAEAAAAVANEGASVWIHDYQLHLVPGMLRELRPDLRIGFFLHIPFPPPELFLQIPWRNTLTNGLLGADLVGFQSPADAANFHRLALMLGAVDEIDPTTVSLDGRQIGIKAFPIGIDAQRFETKASEHTVTEAARDLRARLGNPQFVLLGVDRLDYTKGIDVRLRAFKELFEEERLHPSQIAMIQIAQPSRDNVEAYVSLRERVERLVGEINGDYGRLGVPVIHYLHQTRSFDELLAMYRAADVMLVTPFRDGMNLVAKEYVACRIEDSGALVLSEFAGAAHQMHEALLVNPYDIDGVKSAIMAAVEMSPDDARRRMVALRENVRATDAIAWARDFLGELTG